MYAGVYLPSFNFPQLNTHSSPDPKTTRRFASMDDFFSRCHQPELPSSLCVRVTVTDDRTGEGRDACVERLGGVGL